MNSQGTTGNPVRATNNNSVATRHTGESPLPYSTPGANNNATAAAR